MEENMELSVRTIGFVSSPVKEGIDHSWGEVISEINLDSDMHTGLEGIKGFSHAIVVFYMHKSSFKPDTDLIRRPQGREDMPLTGIFAQRAKHRPNPIGITTVEIIDVHGGKLLVKGLDAIDGTPILDIKPYYPVYDLKNDAKTPEWVDILMKEYF
jgi:tRNA-Thr(GGU) m(6)t(6)A37 methyltransferase TsaA